MRGTEAMRAGDWATARGAYEEGLAGAEAAAPSERFLGDLVPEGHYNLACIYLQRSAGMLSPSAAALEVPQDEASRLRDEAFCHVRAALDLGFPDRTQFEGDVDLFPLHDDARWRELFASRR